MLREDTERYHIELADGTDKRQYIDGNDEGFS